MGNATISESEIKLSTKVKNYNPQKELLVKLIRKWGGLASDALLEPTSQLFFIPDIEGVIGYKVAWGCVVVLGDPVCNPNDKTLLVEAFHEKFKNQNIIYLTASENYKEWTTAKKLVNISVEYGKEYFLDPHEDPQQKQGSNPRLVRKKVRHAINDGVQVSEYLNHDESIETELRKIGTDWLKLRRGPQVHISHLDFFKNRQGKRWFYAKCQNRIVGILVVNQLESQEGWLLNHLIIVPDAPSGTQEYLVTSTLEVLKNEECHFLTFGAIATEDLGEIKGVSKLCKWALCHSFHFANKMFGLNRRKAFWAKFSPKEKSSYILMSKPRIGVFELLALMHAMNVTFKF